MSMEAMVVKHDDANKLIHNGAADGSSAEVKTSICTVTVGHIDGYMSNGYPALLVIDESELPTEARQSIAALRNTHSASAETVYEQLIKSVKQSFRHDTVIAAHVYGGFLKTVLAKHKAELNRELEAIQRTRPRCHRIAKGYELVASILGEEYSLGTVQDWTIHNHTT